MEADRKKRLAHCLLEIPVTPLESGDTSSGTPFKVCFNEGDPMTVELYCWDCGVAKDKIDREKGLTDLLKGIRSAYTSEQTLEQKIAQDSLLKRLKEHMDELKHIVKLPLNAEISEKTPLGFRFRQQHYLCAWL